MPRPSLPCTRRGVGPAAAGSGRGAGALATLGRAAVLFVVPMFTALLFAAPILAAWGAPAALQGLEPAAHPDAGVADAATSATAATAGADTLTLSGVLTVAGDGRPLQGATAEIEALRLAAVTDARGRFTLRNVPEGRHQVEIRALGYRTVRFTLSAPQSEPIRIAVSPEPLEVEGITVEALMETAERNLEARRRAFPGPVRVLGREELDRSGGLVSNAVQSYGAFLVDCVDETGRLVPGEARQCVRRPGVRSARPTVCIDGRRALDGVRQLDGYAPEWLHSVEVFQNGRLIYAYTHEYMRWQAAGRLPVGLAGC